MKINVDIEMEDYFKKTKSTAKHMVQSYRSFSEAHDWACMHAAANHGRDAKATSYWERVCVEIKLLEKLHKKGLVEWD